MKQRYDIKLVQSHDGLAALQDEWTYLWRQNCPDNVFLHFGWISAYVDAFGLEDNLNILLAVRDSEIAAIFPLYKTSRGILRFVGDSRSDYCDFICSEEEAQDVWTDTTAYLLERKDWNALRIKQTPASGNVCGSVINDSHRKYRYLAEEMAPCPGIDLTTNTEDHHKMLNKKSMRRVYNVMARRGELRFRVLDSLTEIEKNLEQLFQMHIVRWRAAGEPSIYESQAQRDFARNYARRLHADGHLHFTVLTCGEEIAAMHMGFLTAGKFIWYKPIYNVEFSDHSPGKVLLRFLLEEMIESGASYFDFTRGSENYKLSLSNNLAQNHGLVIWPSLWKQIRYFLVSIPIRKTRSAARKIRRLLREAPVDQA